MILKSEERIKQINTKLAWLAQYVKFNNQQGMTDINKAVEDFFCGLMNIIFHASLENMNYIQRDYPAVDLGDEDSRLAVQVTSTSSREKIVYTLDKFFEHRLDQHYSRLVILIVGKKEAYKKKFQTMRNFHFDKDSDIWDIDRLGKEISELEDDDQEAVNQYLDQQMKLPWEEYQKAAQTAQRNEAPAVPPVSGEKKLRFELRDAYGFVGREDELGRLEDRLMKKNEKLVFITGLGGMGKTELAVRFGQLHHKDFKFHFVRFSGSFRQTVTLGIAPHIENLRLTEYDNRPRAEDEIYRDAMAVLRACGRDVILIIDNADPADGNFDSLKDQAYRELRKMDLRLIITTRAPVPGGIRVEPMRRPDLHELINKYTQCREEDADALIQAVDGHTLTIDLMARAMVGGWKKVTPQELLNALKTSTLSAAIQKKVTSDYQRDDTQEQKQQQIHEYLRAVFDVAGVPENARQALRCAVLLPEGGMDADLFCDCLPPEAQETLKDLSDHAWLRSDSNIATIHPVIRLVCHESLKPTDESCGPFLDALWKQYDRKKYDNARYTQMAELFTAAAEKLENETGAWSAHGRTLWQEVGQFQKALGCARMTLERREATLPEDHPDLSDAYNDMGLVYQGLSDLPGMEKCFGKALALRLRNPAVDPVDLGKSYNNMGVVYEEKGDYQTALEYKLKALDIFKDALPDDDLDLATSFSHVGDAYGNLGIYTTALEYHLKALAIDEKVLPPEHPDLATAYNNLGSAYSDLGEHQKALEYHLKDLAICEKVLPPDHPDLAATYNDLGSAYSDLGEHQKALEYHQKAQAIQEKVLPTDHPDLAAAYNNLGLAYRNLGEHQKALEYHLKTLAIYKKVLPPDHPHLATTYNNLGLAYNDLGEHQKALEYHQKALAIREKVLPPDHPDLATACNNIGYTYGRLRQYDPAIAYLEKARQIWEAKLPPGHPNIKGVKDNIAYCKNKRDRSKWMSQIQ